MFPYNKPVHAPVITTYLSFSFFFVCFSHIYIFFKPQPAFIIYYYRMTATRLLQCIHISKILFSHYYIVDMRRIYKRDINNASLVRLVHNNMPVNVPISGFCSLDMYLICMRSVSIATATCQIKCSAGFSTPIHFIRYTL